MNLFAALCLWQQLIINEVPPKNIAQDPIRLTTIAGNTAKL
jgi:hypothetical protein